ncbi:AAA family ATPase [Maribacter dokdonensis]|uniref:AAA family ATPase n=1 Tax=Maribacter dokdonensis TaxID=320912 RepID=UPI0025B187BB|nr:AAA family ATPase [Maribacter dokdonensis]
MTFHEIIFSKLLEYRATHPQFSFLTRQRSGSGKRFKSGHWFQGNDKYAFVGLINASGGSNRTRSVGIVVYPTETGFKCDFEVVFNEEKDSELIDVYNAIINKIGKFETLSDTKYCHHIGEVTKTDFSVLFNFLDQYYSIIIGEFALRNKNKLLVTDTKFDQLIDKISEFRESNVDRKYWLFSPGEKASKWEEFQNKNIIALGWDDLGDLKKYVSKDEIVTTLQNLLETDSSKKNDATAVFEFANEIQIGDVIFVKKGTSKLLGYGIVTSDYMFDSDRSEFKHVRTINWQKIGEWAAGHTMVVKTLTNISNYDSTQPEYSTYNEWLMAIINDTQIVEKTVKMNFPLNQILYGPPGTGKTYRTKDIALNILGVDTQDLSREVINDYFTQNVDKGNIVFTTFHQSMSYEDFVEGIKPVVGSEGLTYEVVPGIFKKLCLPEYNELVPGDVFGSRNQYEIFSVTDSILTIKRESGFLPLAMEFVNEIISEFKNGNLSIDDFGSTNRDGLYHKLPTKWDKYLFGYDSIYKGLVKYVTSNEKNKTQAISPKVLIIDEINRGNVSAIFGELITLIEKDKRLGDDEAVTVKLPYSKEYFGVPSNLYIIGTMNTADRSVEALDSALRRRFSFCETPPIPEYIKQYGQSIGGIVDGIDLVYLLRTINKRIEKLLDKDHAIGHSYFLKVKSIEELKAVIANKVVPLLQEYFFGDYGKIGLVMGEGFIEDDATESDEEFFAAFEYEIGSLLSRKVYKIKDALKMDNIEFKEALRKLIG